MDTLNINIYNTQCHTEPVQNLYKDSLDNILNSNIDNIMVKTVHIKSGLLKQSASIMQLYMLQNENILQLSKNFGQADNKEDEQLSSSASEKSSPRLSQSIVPINYFANSTRNISNIKWWQAKASIVVTYKRDVKQIIPLEKLKRESLALEKSIQDNSDLVLVRRLLADLGYY